MPASSIINRSLIILGFAILLNLANSYLAPTIRPILTSFTPGFHQNTTLKLYGSPMSTCTRRVATVLQEKGVPYELVPIDFGKMEQKSPEYIATKQPFGQVPVLQVST